MGVEIEATEFAMARRNLDLRKLWRHLSSELGSGQVAILMLRGASYHWTVACSATETTLRLIDSHDRKVLVRSRCTIADTHSRFQLSPSEMIFLRRVNEW